MLNDFNRTQMLGGVLRDEGYVCCGNYRGYNLRLQQTGENSYELFIPVCSQNDPQRMNLNGWLQQLQQLNPSIIREAGIQYFCARVAFLADGQEALKQNAENIAGSLVSFLSSCGYQPCCEVCGQPKPDVSEGLYNGSPLFMCGSCAGGVTADRTAAPATPAAPVKSNVLLGTIGALIGAAAGGVVWFLLARINVIAGIAGFAMAFLALLLYEKLGGGMDRTGAIICLVATFVMVWLVNRADWAFELYRQLGVPFGQAFMHLGEYLRYYGATGKYYVNLGIGILFTILSTYKTFIAAFAGTSRK